MVPPGCFGPRLGFDEVTGMIDLLYVLGTIAFFLAMIVYIRACEALGHDSESVEERAP